MEVFTPLVNTIITVAVGLAVGSFVAVKFRRPRGWWGFGLAALIVVMVVLRMTQLGYLVRVFDFWIGTDLFLLTAFGTLLIFFLWRLAAGESEPSSPQ